MPEITVPEVRLPKALREMSRDDIQHAIADVKLPKALRDLSRDDIQHAIEEVKLPKALRDLSLEDLQHAIAEIKLPKVEVPDKIVIPRVEIDTKAIERRLPGRRRRRNRLPFLVIGGIALVAAAWFLFNATGMGPRIRRLLGGEERYEEFAPHIDVGQATPGAPRGEGTGVPEGAAHGSGVAVGPGEPQRADQDQIQPAL
jgi:hypothetical protein